VADVSSGLAGAYNGVMRRTFSVLACLSVCFVPVPATGFAQGVLTPPGASGVDEYSETIPSADGNRTVGGHGEQRVLTSRQRKALEQMGPDGRQAAALADATGPPRIPGRSGNPEPDSGTAPPDGFLSDSQKLPPAAGDSGIIATLTRAFGGSGGGLGLVLPFLLLATLLAAVVAGIRRRPTA
jgi:hypothetical protein